MGKEHDKKRRVTPEQWAQVERALETRRHAEIRSAVRDCLTGMPTRDVAIFTWRMALFTVLLDWERLKKKNLLGVSLQALVAAASTVRALPSAETTTLKRNAAAASAAASAAAASAAASAAYAAAYAAAAAAAAAAYAYAASAAYAAAYAASAEYKLFLNRELTLLNNGIESAEFTPPADHATLGEFWCVQLLLPATEGRVFSPQFTHDFAHFDAAVLQWFDAPKLDKQRPKEAIFREYLSNAMAGDLQASQQARLILLGNGGAGKTSLVNCIHDRMLLAYEDATPRICVTTFDITASDRHVAGQPRHDVALALWDFGGQVIMHSTHDFFLSTHASYVVVCNQRANEQPDAWLAMLQARLNSIEPVVKARLPTVFVVYTHCDTENVGFDAEATSDTFSGSGNGHDGRLSNAVWSRENSLRRRFARHFDLSFHHVNMRSCLIGRLSEARTLEATKVNDLVRAIKASALQNEAHEDSIKALTTDIDQVFTRHDSAYLTLAELTNGLGAGITPREWVSDVFAEANAQGTIFPERPISEAELLKSDDAALAAFTVVWQRHWLTYGVYFLINSQAARKNGGLLNDLDIQNSLNSDKAWTITSSGRPVQPAEALATGETLTDETLEYDAGGAALLKRIILNYRWGVSTAPRMGEILLPLAAKLDEPDVSNTAYEALSRVSADEDCEYLEMVFSVAPKDFFFRLVTYLEPHLFDPQSVNNVTELLWRTGVIVHCYHRQHTFAVIEFNNNTLTLKVKGPDKASFRHLLTTYIADNVEFYKSEGRVFTVHTSERIKIDHGEDRIGRKLIEYELVDANLIESLVNEDNDLINKLRKTILQRGMTVTNTINNYGNIGGVANGGGKVDVSHTAVGNNTNLQNVQLAAHRLQQALNADTDIPASVVADANKALEKVQNAGDSQTDEQAVSTEQSIKDAAAKIKDINAAYTFSTNVRDAIEYLMISVKHFFS